MNRRELLYRAGWLSAGALSAQSLFAHSKKASKPKRVLVLGGTDFFGPVLVNELINRGHEVTLFNRGQTNPHLFPQLRKIRGDRELENMAGLAQLQASDETWDWVVDTWQKSSKAVIDSAQLLKKRVGVYQYVSTVSVYDDWHQINIKEDEPLNPVPDMPTDFQTEHRYAIRKTLAELALQNTQGLRHASFRSHGMRGERKRVQESKSEPYWPVKIMRGGKMVMPAAAEYYQVTDMISLARFMVHCGEQGHTGPFNVAYEPFSFKDFAYGIKKLTDSDVEFFWLPQDFIEQHGEVIYRTNRAGRYRFNVDRAIKHGLQNRSLDLMNADQIKGYRKRHPKDDFEFGAPGTHSMSKAQELELIKLWQQTQAVKD